MQEISDGLSSVLTLVLMGDGWFIHHGPTMVYQCFGYSCLVHIINTSGDYETHESLDMRPSYGRFCLFSSRFSPDSREILGGSSDGCIYIYDLDRRERIERVSIFIYLPKFRLKVTLTILMQWHMLIGQIKYFLVAVTIL